VCEITPRVVEVLKACDLIRYSRSSWLFAKIQATWPDAYENNFKKTLPKMCARGLIKKVNTKERLFNAAYQPDVYEITHLGRQVLYDAGVPLTEHRFGATTKNPRWFPHTLMVCDIIHSMNLKESIVTQDAIFAKAPEPTFTIPVKDKSLTPDALCGIEFVDKTFSFFAIEADTGSESMKVINTKLDRYLEILVQRLYMAQWRIPFRTFHPMFVTRSAHRLLNMKAELLKLTNGRGNSHILFKLTKGDVWKAPHADHHMTSEPYERAGYQPFYICTEAKAFQK
jgi:Replication-relaxation